MCYIWIGIMTGVWAGSGLLYCITSGYILRVGNSKLALCHSSKGVLGEKMAEILSL